MLHLLLLHDVVLLHFLESEAMLALARSAQLATVMLIQVDQHHAIERARPKGGCHVKVREEGDAARFRGSRKAREILPNDLWFRVARFDPGSAGSALHEARLRRDPRHVDLAVHLAVVCAPV